MCVFFMTCVYPNLEDERSRRFLLAIILYPSWHRPPDCILLCQSPFLYRQFNLTVGL